MEDFKGNSIEKKEDGLANEIARFSQEKQTLFSHREGLKRLIEQWSGGMFFAIPNTSEEEKKLQEQRMLETLKDIGDELKYVLDPYEENPAWLPNRIDLAKGTADQLHTWNTVIGGRIQEASTRMGVMFKSSSTKDAG